MCQPYDWFLRFINTLKIVLATKDGVFAVLIAVMLTTALGSQVPLNPTELTGVVSYVNTRVTGGILAFLISAIGYAGTALVIGAVGNRIDKKVRIYR